MLLLSNALYLLLSECIIASCPQANIQFLKYITYRQTKAIESNRACRVNVRHRQSQQNDLLRLGFLLLSAVYLWDISPCLQSGDDKVSDVRLDMLVVCKSVGCDTPSLIKQNACLWPCQGTHSLWGRGVVKWTVDRIIQFIVAKVIGHLSS